LDATPLQRAIQSAPDRRTAEEPVPEQEFFCFKLGEFQFGVSSEHVLEVLRAGPLTPLPKTPAFILGVCAHRGDVLPVLDVLRFLGKGETRLGSRTRLFVGLSGTFVAAMVADSIIGLRRFPLAEILPVPIGDSSAFEHLSGVAKGLRGATILLLNLPMIFQSARQRAVSG
jgi:purine-binding chemotaxis protein CheW